MVEPTFQKVVLCVLHNFALMALSANTCLKKNRWLCSQVLVFKPARYYSNWSYDICSSFSLRENIIHMDKAATITYSFYHVSEVRWTFLEVQYMLTNAIFPLAWCLGNNADESLCSCRVMWGECWHFKRLTLTYMKDSIKQVTIIKSISKSESFTIQCNNESDYQLPTLLCRLTLSIGLHLQ